MAETVLHNLTASTLFDLVGIVAVVTGGGSVCPQLEASICPFELIPSIGNWADDKLHLGGQWCYGLRYRTQPDRP
jgi:hypothetical protein